MRKYIAMLALAVVVAAAALATVAGAKTAAEAWQETTDELQAMSEEARGSRDEGQIMDVLGRMQGRLEAFRAEYPDSPEAVEALYHLASVSWSRASITRETDYFAETIRHFSGYVLANSPESPRENIAIAHYYLAESYRMTGKYDEAKHEYDVVLKEYGDINPRLTEMARSNMMGLEAEQRLAVGNEPIEFSVKSITGETISPDKYKGKVLLIDFWATWCRPCIAEMPNVKKVYDKYKDQGFEIVGISLDRSRQSLDSYIQSNGIEWPQYFDGKYWNNDIAEQYGVKSIPATFLIDRSGKIRYKSVRGQQLERAVGKLIQEKI